MTRGSKTSGGQAGGTWLRAGLSLVFAASVASASGQEPAKPPQPATSPTAAADPVKAEEEFIRVAEATIERACRTCHPIENILRLRRTSREWSDMITAMAGRGATATDDEFDMIHQYLTRYYGRVRINAAPADELSAVLGLTAKDAAAIVEHRKAHGKFADVAAVLKVQGIDRTKIEEQPEALIFD